MLAIPLLLVPALILLLSRLLRRTSLDAIPAAHPLAPYTPLWITYIRWRGREIATIHAAHARLGPVVRLAPMEVSVNCVEGGLKEVYAGGRYGKSEWYSFFSNYRYVLQKRKRGEDVNKEELAMDAQSLTLFADRCL